MKNNIILITDNFRLAQKIRNKMVLLRETDSFEVIEPDNYLEEIKKLRPSVIYFHLTKFNEEEFFDFLQRIKNMEELKTSSVLLIYDFLSEDILCSAFELGITDFISTKATETEITIRTIWALQKQEKEKIIKQNSDILSELKIFDKTNNIYTENYITSIIEKECSKTNGSFIIISPDINSRNNLSPSLIINIIKKSIRKEDIVGMVSESKIYIWLKNAKKEHSLALIKKIQKKLEKEITISASYIETKKENFSYIEKITKKALSTALLKGNSFVFIDNTKEKNNSEITDLQQELNKLLSPLFYQLQKRYEEKLFETKIYQSVDNEKFMFKLENNLGQYSIFVSINNNSIEIEVLRNIEEKEIKAEKITYNDFSTFEEEIESLIKTIIKDFQKDTNC